MSSVISRDPTQIRTRCAVCGFAEIRTDAVEDLFLAECPRCDHRWTFREFGTSLGLRPGRSLEVGRPASVRIPQRVFGETASAA